jgi:Family of unknown function (DUF5681)
MTKRNKGDYEVGFGRPPHANRFKPGQSGNPGGRPKGAKSINTMMHEALYRKITISENGSSRKITVVEGFFRKVTKSALEGDRQAAGLMLKLLSYADQLGEQSNGSDGQGSASGFSERSDKADREILQYFAQQVRDGKLDLAIEGEEK